MEIKQDIPPHIQRIAEDIDKQITMLEDSIRLYEEQINKAKDLIKTHRITKEAYLKHQPYQITFTQVNAPLTRDLIRNLLRGHSNYIRNVEIIDLIYRGKTDEERSKLIKTLSVILNILEKDGEIEILKKKGVKGNYYKWKRK